MPEQFSIEAAASLVFSTLLCTYLIALVWAWRASVRSPEETGGGLRARLRILDDQTRLATSVTFYFGASVILGALFGKIL
jgi:hypothetical protein